MGLLDYDINYQPKKKTPDASPVDEETQRYVDEGRAEVEERLSGALFPEIYTKDLTQDDYVKFGKERIQSKEHGLVGEIAAGLGRGALRVAVTPFELADVAGEAVGWKGLEKAGEAGVERIEKYIEESPRLKKSERLSRDIREAPELWTDPNWYISIASEALPTLVAMMIPGLAAGKAAQLVGWGTKGIIAAGTAGAFGAGSALEAGGAAANIREYEKQSGKEVPISKKLKAVIGTGVVAGGLEIVPIFAVFGKVGAAKLISRVIKGMIAEGSTEGAQEIVANYFAKEGYDPDQELVQGVIESIIGGVMLGGGMGAISRATNFKERVEETDPDEVSDILEKAEEETESERVAAVEEITKEADITPNKERFEENPLDDANNAEYLDKYIKKEVGEIQDTLSKKIAGLYGVAGALTTEELTRKRAKVLEAKPRAPAEVSAEVFEKELGPVVEVEKEVEEEPIKKVPQPLKEAKEKMLEAEKAEKEPEDKIIPLQDRPIDEKRKIEAYNKKMDSDEWVKAYESELDMEHFTKDEGHSPLADELLKDLERDEIKKGANILEIGSGRGRDGIYFAQKGHIVRGIDVSEKAVKISNESAKGQKATFEVGDAENLYQFEDSSQDAVYSVAALHGTPIKFTFKEIYRVLKPGGQAKLFLYTRTKTGEKWISYWTPGEIKQYATENNFKIEKFREVSDTDPISIPGVKGKVEQETHIVVTTLRKPKGEVEKPSEFYKPTEKKPSKVRTLRGRIKELGGINFLNFKGELKDMSTAVKYLSEKAGLQVDLTEEQLRSEGWLSKDESLLEVLRIPENLRRNRVLAEGVEKPEYQKTEREKRVEKEIAHEPEAPPKGEYTTMNAEDLPIGKNILMLEDKTERGWDNYKVIKKDPFEITLEDDTIVKLSPLDKVQVLKKDLGVKKEVPKQAELIKGPKETIFGAPEEMKVTKRKPTEKGLAGEKVEREETSKFREGKLFGPDERQQNLFDNAVKEGYIKTDEIKEAKTAFKQLELDFTPREKPKGRPVSGELPADSVRTRMATTGRIRAGSAKVQTGADAAALVAHIRKYAQELFYSVVTDKSGDVLEIHRYTKGVKGASQISPIEVAGSILNVSEATNAYLIHNHPTGSLRPSADDMLIHGIIGLLLDLKNITSNNLILAKTDFAIFSHTGAVGDTTAITPQKRNVILPEKERMIIGTPGEIADNSILARHLIDARYKSKNGFLLLNSKNRDIGFFEYPKGKTTKEGSAELIKRLEKTNATTLVFFSDKPLVSVPSRARFVDAVKNALTDIAIVDILERQPSGEIESQGDRGRLRASTAEKRIDALEHLGSEEILYATRQTKQAISGSGITLEDVQSIFKGQKTGLSKDGNIWVKLKAGYGFQVKSVNQIKEDRLAFEVGRGRMKADGEFIAGKFEDDTIEIAKGIGDKWTLAHESEHMLESIGLISSDEISMLKTTIRRLVRQGKFETTNKKDIGGQEDRAKFIETELYNRANYTGYTQRILNKIADWVDALVNLFKRTTRGLVREFEAGKVFEREVTEKELKAAPAMFATKAEEDILTKYKEKNIAWEAPKTEFNMATAKKLVEKVYTKFVMAEYPVMRLAKLSKSPKMIENVENLLRRIRGKGGIAEEMLTGKGPSKLVNFGTPEEKIEYVKDAKSLQAILSGLATQEEYSDYETLRIAERDVALATYRPDIKGTDLKESSRVIEVIENKYGDGIKKLRDISKQHREFERQTILKPLVDIGWLSKKQYQDIISRPESEYYASFAREMDTIEEYVLGGKDPLKKIKGSERRKVPTIESTIANVYKATKLGETLRLNKEVVKLRDLTPDLAEIIKEVQPHYIPVKQTLEAEVDPKMRKELDNVTKDLGATVETLKNIGRNKMGQFIYSMNALGLAADEANRIELKFATTEKTYAHEIGHLIDRKFRLQELLIKGKGADYATIKKELRKVADQRAADDASAYYKKYIRKREEQVAEFVSRYLTQPDQARELAPEAVKKLEGLFASKNQLKALLKIRPSGQATLAKMSDVVFAKSPIPPKNSIVVPVNGFKHFWQVPPDVHKALDYYSPHEMSMAVKLLSYPTRLLRAGATLSAEFIMRNPVRDQFTAMTYSKYGYMPFWDLGKGMFHLINKTDLYHEYKAAGAEQAYFTSLDRTTLNVTARDMLKFKKGLRTYNPIEYLRIASEFMEKSTRLGIAARAKAKGASVSEMMAASRESTVDFLRIGEERRINQIIAFWNANVQGIDLMRRNLTKHPGRTLLRLTLGITIPSIALWMFNHSDDEREKTFNALPEWRKNFFWNIIVKDGLIISLPKPFELGIIFGSLPERILDYIYLNDPKELKSIAQAMKDGALPGLWPTAALPLLENITNWSFFMERPIESEATKELPPAMRATQYTSTVVKKFGKVTGISPLQTENWIRAWTGSLGKTGLNLIDPLFETDEIPEVEKHWYEVMPGIKGFITKKPIGSMGKDVNRFYDNLEEIVQAEQGYKLLIKTDRSEARKFDKKTNRIRRFAVQYRKASRLMGKIRKRKATVMESKVYAPDRKRTMIERLDERMSRIAKLYNDRLLKYRQRRKTL